jgi:hypothetical protein
MITKQFGIERRTEHLALATVIDYETEQPLTYHDPYIAPSVDFKVTLHGRDITNLLTAWEIHHITETLLELCRANENEV